MRRVTTMDFKQALRDGCYLNELKGDTKEDVMEEMVDLLAGAGKIKDRRDALRAVLEREGKMSTGMQQGIAIPHGKAGSIDKLVTAVALKKNGIDFKSLDGEPSRIFVMTLSPLDNVGPHLKYMAEISKLLIDDGTRDRLLSTSSPDEMLAVLAG